MDRRCRPARPHVQLDQPDRARHQDSAVATAMTLATGRRVRPCAGPPASRASVDWVLKSARGAGALPLSRFSSVLVVAEVAFSLILLVGAALMIRTFGNLQAIDPGFEPGGLVAMEVSLPTDKYVGEGSRSAFFEAVRERLRGNAGRSRRGRRGRRVWRRRGSLRPAGNSRWAAVGFDRDGEIPSNRVTAGLLPHDAHPAGGRPDLRR